MRQLEFPENIQAIVGGKEYSLDNAVLKIWPESEETNGICKCNKKFQTQFGYSKDTHKF